MTRLACLAAAGSAVFIGLAATAQAPQAPPAATSRLPPETCRIWHRGVPPERQPPPTDCATARRQAAIAGGEVIAGPVEPGGAFRFSDSAERYRREREARDARERERAEQERDRDWRDGTFDDRDWREDVEPWR